MIGKGLPCFVGRFLVMGPVLADGVLGAVVPDHLGFAVHIIPVSPHVPDGTHCIAALLEIDEECSSVSIATLPSAHIMPARRSLRSLRIRRSSLFGNMRWTRKLHPFNV